MSPCWRGLWQGCSTGSEAFLSQRPSGGTVLSGRDIGIIPSERSVLGTSNKCICPLTKTSVGLGLSYRSRAPPDMTWYIPFEWVCFWPCCRSGEEQAGNRVRSAASVGHTGAAQSPRVPRYQEGLLRIVESGVPCNVCLFRVGFLSETQCFKTNRKAASCGLPTVGSHKTVAFASRICMDFVWREVAVSGPCVVFLCPNPAVLTGLL